MPADCRLIKTSNLKVEESSLTGETLPVLKDENKVLSENIPIGDIVNMAFASSIVAGGHAEAIVVETRMNTKVGKIANMIIEDKAPETPIQRKLAGVSKTLGIACLVICALVFIIGLFKRIEPYVFTKDNKFERKFGYLYRLSPFYKSVFMIYIYFCF